MFSLAAGLVVAIIAGMALLAKSVNSRTAFVLSVVLIVVMSGLMAFNVVGFFSGIVITIVAGLIILGLDEIGILA